MGKYNRGASTNIIHIISDCVFGFLAFIIAILIAGEGNEANFNRDALIAVTFMVVYMISSKESRIYNITTFFYADRIIKYITKSFLIAMGVVSILLFYVSNQNPDSLFYLSFLIVVYIFMIVSAFSIRFFIKNKKELAPRTLMIGSYEKYGKFNNYMYKSNIEIDIIGYVSATEEDRGKSRYIGHIDELEHLIRENNIDQIYIMQSKGSDIDEVQDCISQCLEMGVTTRIIMNSYSTGTAQSYVSSVGTYPVVTYHTVTLNMSSKAVKRFIDIVGSIIGIVISSPIMLITAIAIILESRGPVIFKQERVGMNGRHFMMLKFRSMCVDAEDKKKDLLNKNEICSGMMFKIKDDPRVTRVGRIIRKTSIDELPQFFNVLLGDMSLVGTRPPTVDEVEKYERVHWRRISIKPGLTGMWQISGRSSIRDFNEIVELDTEYIDKWSVLLDFRIIIKTAIQVLVGKGAF